MKNGYDIAVEFNNDPTGELGSVIQEAMDGARRQALEEAIDIIIPSLNAADGSPIAEKIRDLIDNIGDPE